MAITLGAYAALALGWLWPTRYSASHVAVPLAALIPWAPARSSHRSSPTEHRQGMRIRVMSANLLMLNETTPQHRDIRRLGLRDAWDIAGRGRGATWPNLPLLRHLPGFRLDHMYVSRDIDVVRVRRGRGRGSDHRPVIADVIVW